MLALLAAAAAAQIATAPVTKPPPSCSYDRAAMLALDQHSFDQDMSGGWRKLALQGCDLAAADLIRDWRVAHGSEADILYWHEGQLRANAGQTPQAIELFEKSRKPAAEDAPLGWNLYVDGSIAFLRRDRASLEQARAKLASLPRPAWFNPTGPDGKPLSIAWPLNLHVLDSFLRCWDKNYKEAYGCAPPVVKVPVRP